MCGRVKSIALLLLVFLSFTGKAQVIRTLLGDGTVPATSGDGNNGPCVLARMTQPYGVAVDRKGNVYVSDQTWNVVRRIRPDGLITRYAGNASGTPLYAGDGLAAVNAGLSAPKGLYCDSIGNLYIADAGNHVVRKVDTFGIITTVAGSNTMIASSTFGDGGPATNAGLGACTALTFDAAGNMYIANGNDRVRKVNTSGIISLYAGGSIGYAGNGGQATAASMDGVTDLVFDASGNLLVTEANNHVVRKIAPGGIISTYIGNGTSGTAGDGSPATASTVRLNAPHGIKFDAAGNLYICEYSGNKIRRVNTAGIISSYAGPSGANSSGYAGDGSTIGTTTRFLGPASIWFDRLGHLFVTDQNPAYTGGVGGRRMRQIFNVDTFQILASPSLSLCSADTINFTANHSGIYYSWEYRWKVNGVAAGTNSKTFRPTSFANGDRVSCTIIDTARGGMLLAISDTVTISVSGSVTPSVTISSTADTVCVGTTVLYSATPVNGGSAPTYQWMVNGSVVGTGASYSYIPANNDSVKVRMTSNATCPTITTVTSNTRRMRVNVLPDAGTLSGASLVCPGSTITLSSSGATGGTWSAANATATVSTTGGVTGVAPGTDTISYIVTTPTCGSDTAKKIVSIGTLPDAGSISGLASVCPGSGISLTATVPGGTWSVSNARATVSSSGVVTGISAGIDTVYYVATTSCGADTARHIVAVGVSSLLDAGTITGPATVCNGTSVSLSDTASGGFWGTTDPAVAGVSASGAVTAMSPGSAIIYYVVTSGCSPDTAFHNITVIPVLSAGTITGTSSLCAGLSASLANTATGGVWSTSAPSVVTISTSGSITALTAGSATIRYIVGNSCGADTATHPVTVDPLPFAGTITGNFFVCTGSNISLTDTASGGTWSSSAPFVATVSPAGVVTGLVAGSTTITYTVTNGCGTDIATHAVTVNPFPAFTSTTTPPDICSGTLFTYTPTASISGATFSWTRPAVPGIANPIASSTSNPNEILINSTALPIDVVYIFAVGIGGCSTVQNVTVTVNPIPSLSSPLSVTACSGRLFTYAPASATPGTTYAWTRSPVTGITPASASGTGTEQETLVNATTAAVTTGVTFTLTANGCSATQTVTVSVEPQGPPPPTITTHSPSWLCKGTAFQNFGTSSAPAAGTTYEWSATGAAVWAQGLGHQYSLVNFPYSGYATIYLSSSVAGMSCTSRDSFVVYVDANTNEVPTVDYISGVFIAPSGMASYQWGYDDVYSLDSTILAGETAAEYVNSAPDFAGKYYWVMTEHYFCKQKTYYTAPAGVVKVDPGSAGTLSVYPNPNMGVFTVQVQLPYNEQATILIADITGRVVKEVIAVTNSKVVLQLNEPTGVYTISVITGHGRLTSRVTVSQ